METYLTTESKGYRLVQLRVDNEWLKYPENIGTQSVIPQYRMPGEFLGCWRETGRRTNKLHYHSMFIVPDTFKKKDWAPKWLHILKPGSPDSCKCIKFYNSKNFTQGRNWAYYIGYCAKCNDPMGLEFPYSQECRNEYDRINKETGSDDYFKSYILKRLNSESTTSQIIEVCRQWYLDNFKDHDPLKVSQKYWKVLGLLDPNRYHNQMELAVNNILASY